MARIPFALAEGGVPDSAGLPQLSLGAATASGAALADAGAELIQTSRRLKAEAEQAQREAEIAAEKQQRIADANGITTASSALQTRMLEEFDRFSQSEDATDPTFTARWTKRSDELIAEEVNRAVGPANGRRISPLAEADLRARAATLKGAYWETSLSTQRQAQGKAAQDAWAQATNVFGAQAMASPSSLTYVLGEIDDMTVRYLGADGVSENALRDARLKMRAATIESAIGGALDRRDLKTARSILGDPSFAADLDPSRRGVLNNAIEATKRQIDNEAKAAFAAYRSEVRETYNDIKASIAAGLPVSPGRIAAVESALAKAGDAGRASEAAALGKSLEWIDVAKTETPAAVQLKLAELYTQINEQGGDATPEQRFKIEATEKLLGTMRREISTDMLSFATKVGTAQVTPITFEGDAAAQSFKNRIGVALATGERYGVPPQFLTSAERDQFSVLLADPNPARAAGAMRAVAEGFGAYADQVFAEIAPKEKVVAHLGGLMLMGSGSAGVAVEALEGLKDSANEIVFDEALARDTEGQVIADALRDHPGVRGAVIKAARGLYKKRIIAAGAGAGAFDPVVYADALQAMVGEQMTAEGPGGGFGDGLAGERIVLPPGFTPEGFQDLVAELRDEDLVFGSVGGGVPTFENGDALTAEELRENARLRDFGNGVYTIDYADPERTVRGSGPNGLYLIDLARLAPRVFARRQLEKAKRAGAGPVP